VKIQTASGRWVDPLAPALEDLHVEDVAHALSQLARFGGHGRLSDEGFSWTVALHSVEVARRLERAGHGREVVRCGLMHDATEAYLVDVPRPVKHRLPEYRAVEDALWRALATRFALPEVMPPAVHQADTEQLFVEAVHFMNADGWDVPVALRAEPRPRVVSPVEARALFLAEFVRLS
jgi:5'-deoxynucleotidase YfbR-like HD superfamily hydrolase